MPRFPEQTEHCETIQCNSYYIPSFLTLLFQSYLFPARDYYSELECVVDNWSDGFVHPKSGRGSKPEGGST